MKGKIAVATVSGKAYYHLVNELKARGLPFLSLTPYDIIPTDIEVVITTENERKLINHPNVMVFEENTDPATIVNEAIRSAEDKQNHDTITVGIDPGKTFGMAVLSNGNVLETMIHSSIEQTEKAVLDVLTKNPATTYIIKVGDGAPEYTRVLLSQLDEALHKDVAIEIVSEAGTSRFAKETVHRRGLRDAMSAVKIAERRGRPFQREKGKQQ
ncbi:MAG: hypothetical protein OEZ35_01480 [Candidatus Bathyarchaeota archaeon]|nr:hypothetical protein [Candidatus Bathyarchaeota archaeon]